jgi:uncharacterized membrane protein YdjX (TVP38/TMEM64 family)
MRRIATLILGVAGAVIASKLLVENVLGIQTDALIEAWMSRAGTGSAIVMMSLLAADLFLPIPSSLIMVLSGAAFGVLWGSAFSLVGSIGGEWLGFELVRKYGRRASSSIVGDEELDRLGRIFARHGAAVIVVTRAAGTAPIVVVYAYAGAVSRQTGSLVPAVIMLIAVAGLGWIVYRARIAQKETS